MPKKPKPNPVSKVELSSGWTSVQLGDLLNGDQLREVIRILRQSSDPSKELKTYLAQFKDELEAKGVMSDYLAYALVFKRDELLKRAKGH